MERTAYVGQAVRFRRIPENLTRFADLMSGVFRIARIGNRSTLLEGAVGSEDHSAPLVKLHEYREQVFIWRLEPAIVDEGEDE